MTLCALTDRLDLWRQLAVRAVRSDAPDLTARQQAIVLTVSLLAGPHTVRGLARQLNIAKPAVTRALDTLEAYEFVRRRRDEADLRSVLIERTPAGLDYLGQCGALAEPPAIGDKLAGPDPTSPRA